jgi:hypothetical protein
MRDMPRIGVLFVWMAFAFALVNYFVDWTSVQRWMLTASRGTAAAKTPADVSDGRKPFTGAILFVPPRGDFCSKWIFDNRNGDMWDGGQVDCSVAAPRDPGEGMSAERMRAIGKAFKE